MGYSPPPENFENLGVLFMHSESIIIPFCLTTYGINCVIFFLNI